MRVYLVGGAVRDKLLGLPVTERDWVVVGASPEEMLRRGFKAVGKDFPVFLHPRTKEEYALARTERKTGPGYRGFAFHAAPDVTLEQDLARRDLTINAIAETTDGELVDPFGGKRDLEQRLLRHVSPAFAEDPVRILRLARFAARYHRLGFKVAPETMALCQRMVAAGEVDALVPERVWQELAKALMEPSPEVFITVLRECGALARLMPEVDRLFGIPQPPQHHPEIDTGVHVLLALRQAARLSDDLCVRFAVLVHDLGKGTTPPEELPRHRGHEHRGVPLVEALCRRLRAPNDCRDLGCLVAKLHLHCHTAFQLRPQTVLKLFEQLDAFRRPQRLEQFVRACEADARGRTGLEDRPYPQADYLREAHAAAMEVSGGSFARQGLKGTAVAAAVRQERIARIAAIKQRWQQQGE
ncbi:MAG: multifunctional CCA addition/repair protein [Xanthomonadaceae bacterium]|nr:multifunctional CCA addition/repair protein [Xanthomonadaceae bacterium]